MSSWEQVQEQLAQGMSWARSLEVAASAGNLSLPQALLEAVVEIDSSQADAVATLGEGGLVAYTDDGSVRPGKLQRLEQIRKTFFGDPATQQRGLLDTIREQGATLVGPDAHSHQ